MPSYFCNTNQNIEPNQKLALNKDGTVRRTNRKKYTFGYAISKSTNGVVWVFVPMDSCRCTLDLSEVKL